MAERCEMTYAITIEEELKKNPDFPVNDLKLLKEWAKGQAHLPPIPEERLVLFHFSCWYDLDKTKSCIETYYTLRSNTPEFFSNRDLSSKALQAAESNVTCFVLPKRTTDGYLILYQKVESSDASKYNFDDTCKLFFMTMDAFLRTEGTLPGVIFLLDYTNIRFGHLAKANISSIKKMFQYVQEGAPIRLKSIHMVNMNYFVEKVMTFVKPFMNKELNELIHYYQESCLNNVYKYIPQDCLPSDYGGDLPSCRQLKAQFIDNFINQQDFFFSDERFFRCNESLRQSTRKLKRSQSMRRSFRKLDID
ncbi:alpha-tocopherol transfer protein-like [Macrosteles quadrilineatus]|uniref:alpha-tocopherol transfer protein-like n=1 Tax=Macrosteles quadrilineatus TaxID=74068 RepID=UPI0023E2CEB7|nr:alpha-tocopherol transfer protein-like [Macrosteles quadrilineatus]